MILFLTVVQLLAVTIALTAASLPIVWRFFKGSAVGVLTFSALFSLISVSYFTYVAASTRILSYSPQTMIIGLAAVAAVSAFSTRGLWHELWVWLYGARRILILTFLMFGGLLTLFISLKSHSPEIYQIERFMDFGFIAALNNTQTLPLGDIWLSGEILNYYYFGHIMAHMLIVFAQLPLEIGFFAVQGWLFAVLSMTVFAAALEYVRFILPKKTNGSQIWFALLSMWLTVFGGGLYTGWLFLRQFFTDTTDSFWYAVPARIIDGGITEYPIFSFIASDLHAHTWGLLFAAFAMLFSAMLQRSMADESEFKARYFLPHLVTASLILAAAFMTNAWDVLTVGAIVSLGILSALWRYMGIKSVVYIALLGLISFGLSVVWYGPYSAPLTGVSLVTDQSHPWQWLQFWGVPFSILIAAVLVSCPSIKKWMVLLVQRSSGLSKGLPPIVAPLLLVVFLWVVMEVVYFEDILLSGEWFRANTMFKLTSQAWVFIGVLTGPLIALVLRDSNKKARWPIIAGFTIVVLSGSLYVFQAVPQGLLRGESRGLESGFSWIEDSYPDDYRLLRQLQIDVSLLAKSERQSLVLLEAEGESYKDNARMSVGLGISTVVGYPVHEWTWRGSYDEIGARRQDVKTMYTSQDLSEVTRLLEKYDVGLIVIGELERQYYPELAGEAAIHEISGSTISTGNATAIFIR